MDTIYANSGEKFLKAVKLYPDENGILCVDEDATEMISTSGLINLFEKGEIVVVTDDGEFVPVSLTVTDGDGAFVMVITTEESEGAYTLAYRTFYSDAES